MIELGLANLKRVAEWRGKFCLKAANQKSRKEEFAGKPSKLLKDFRRPYNVGPTCKDFLPGSQWLPRGEFSRPAVGGSSLFKTLDKGLCLKLLTNLRAVLRFDPADLNMGLLLTQPTSLSVRKGLITETNRLI